MFEWRTAVLVTRSSLLHTAWLRASSHALLRQSRTVTVTCTRLPPRTSHAFTYPHEYSLYKNLMGVSKRDAANIDFEYETLDPKKAEIRLLRLCPAEREDETIRCELIHTPLNGAPPYLALSYAWGDRCGTQEILVNNMAFLVTPNLKHALRRLRPRTGDRDAGLILWVDAICINQNDVPERNVQTAKMRMIYQTAESVAVWVGLEYQRSERAMQFAIDLNAATSEQVRDIVRDPAMVDTLLALVVLFRRQYWWRIWVIQEVCCAKNAIVYCGHDSIPWAALDNVCDILKGEEEYLQTIFYKSPSYTRTLVMGGPRGLQLSRYSPGAAAPPLFELLLSHKSKQSTDPKDKVYALVGISSARDTFGEIDYSRSLRETYTHTARHIISTTKKLDVICANQNDKDQFGLPSWVPDWTRPPRRSGHTIIGLHHSPVEFGAAGQTLAAAGFVDGGYVLKTAGLIIDRIKAIGIPFERSDPQNNLSRCLHVFQQWWTMFAGFQGSHFAAKASFCRTISCGNWSAEDEHLYSDKLEAIFNLADSQLAFAKLEPGTEDQQRPPPMAEPDPWLSKTQEEKDEAKRQTAIFLSVSLTMNKRSLVMSSANHVGLAPRTTTTGDVICVLLGCRFPVILRRVEEHYILIGEAYVDGFMAGEAMLGLENGQYTLQSLEIH